MGRLEKQQRSMRTNNLLENMADLAVFFLLTDCQAKCDTSSMKAS